MWGTRDDWWEGSHPGTDTCDPTTAAPVSQSTVLRPAEFSQRNPPSFTHAQPPTGLPAPALGGSLHPPPTLPPHHTPAQPP